LLIFWWKAGACRVGKIAVVYHSIFYFKRNTVQAVYFKRANLNSSQYIAEAIGVDLKAGSYIFCVECSRCCGCIRRYRLCTGTGGLDRLWRHRFEHITGKMEDSFQVNGLETVTIKFNIIPSVGSKFQLKAAAHVYHLGGHQHQLGIGYTGQSAFGKA